MRTRRLLLLGVLLASATVGVIVCYHWRQAQQTKKLAGVWTSEPPRALTLYFEDGRVGWQEWCIDGGTIRAGYTTSFEVVLDPWPDPKEITLTMEDGDWKVVRRGIYTLDGDNLTVAFSTDLKSRPTTFDDPKAQVYRLRRVKEP